MSKPLNIKQLIAAAKARETVFLRFFENETEGDPSTAWRVRLEGEVRPFHCLRAGRRGRSVPREYVEVSGRIFDERRSIEEGTEVEGYGFIYFFKDRQAADMFVHLRRRRFANEVAAIAGAVNNFGKKHGVKINIA